MSFANRLLNAANRFHEKKQRDAKLIKSLKQKMSEAAGKGLYFYETENLGCMVEDIPRVIQLLTEEGLTYTKEYREREAYSIFYEYENRYETYVIHRFSWRKT